MVLYCATSNAGKLREFRIAASDLCRIEPLPDLASIQPPEETGVTFEENAILKARVYGAHTGGLLFAEDSGLEVDALGGEPGVYSARYSDEGTDASNNQRVLDNLANMAAPRTARFVCVIALVDNGRLIHTFRGTVEGEILTEPRGPHGFGYDPIFYYPPFGCTFGEVERERKQTVSHRGQALRQLLDYLFANHRDRLDAK
jgi:XTP/dITP diphosphohydrolase